MKAQSLSWGKIQVIPIQADQEPAKIKAAHPTHHPHTFWGGNRQFQLLPAKVESCITLFPQAFLLENSAQQIILGTGWDLSIYQNQRFSKTNISLFWGCFSVFLLLCLLHTYFP